MSHIENRNIIGGMNVMPDGEGLDCDDNLAIALATYFENRMDCPEDQENDDTGWKPWAVEHTYNLIDRIVNYTLTIAANRAIDYADNHGQEIYKGDLQGLRRAIMEENE